MTVKRNGYTIIELCAVMAIMSILFTITLLGAKTLRARANDVHTKAGVRGLSLIMLSYFSAHREKYPVSMRQKKDGGYYHTCYESLDPASYTAIAL